MKLKHKVINDFQYLSPDKKIFILKVGTVLEEYTFKVKSEVIPIDKDIIDNNPEFFEVIDYKAELLAYLKIQKIQQPAQVHKKLIPFIEEMILSSIQQTGNSISPSMLREIEKREDEVINLTRELERKESDLNSRERRIKDKEDEIEIRLKRLDKREADYKMDLNNLDKKEDDLRNISKELTEKDINIQDKLQDINERERNIDRNILQSAQEIDSKYKDLQIKIDNDLKVVSDKEQLIERLTRELKSKESELIDRESSIEDKSRNLLIKEEELNLEEQSLMKIDQEIKEWESLHWKMQRNTTPPSAIV